MEGRKKNKEIKQDNNYLNLLNFFSHKMSGSILQNLGRKSKTFEDIKTNKQKLLVLYSQIKSEKELFFANKGQICQDIYEILCSLFESKHNEPNEKIL